ncbi:hypothetical protein M2272_002598 [Mycobacterium frederiksbergense]|uniref:Uncharacterized protein n=1 Tax=Mycolicibacterium frederiksbergense TaxID=117567 RepID=A0ABT6KZ32_9MYCO|nr:hypothetical protein [Mycolicibacterium frederiksbergense]
MMGANLPAGRRVVFTAIATLAAARRSVDEPKSFAFVDGFADLDFNPNPALSVFTNVFTFAEHNGGTRATCVSTYESAEAL